MSLRKRLLDLIDQSGLADREISLLATGTPETVRNMRRGAIPRLETLQALYRVLGFGLKIVPLDEQGQGLDGAPAVEKQPEWAIRLREEIRRDLVEILGRDDKGNSRCDPAAPDHRGEKGPGTKDQQRLRIG